MTTKEDTSKVQHYVPKMLLRNFTKGKKPHIWAFDKQDRKTFSTNIKNIAAESYFYDISGSESTLSLEPALEKLETSSSQLIKKILRKGNIGWLTDEDKISLSLFISVQKLRTPHVRHITMQMASMLKEKIISMGGNPNNVENYKPFDKASLKEFSIWILSKAHEFIPHFLSKAWVLLKGKKDYPFYISDNPIALQNINEYGPYGSLGLAVTGIEIYLPLSSVYTLALLCPSYEKQIREAYATYKRLSIAAPFVVNSIIKAPFSIEKIMAGIDEGMAVDCVDDNIVNLNYLQVRHAERYVYCQDDNFALAYDMLDKTDAYKVGPRFV